MRHYIGFNEATLNGEEFKEVVMVKEWYHDFNVSFNISNYSRLLLSKQLLPVEGVLMFVRDFDSLNRLNKEYNAISWNSYDGPPSLNKFVEEKLKHIASKWELIYAID